MNHTILTPELLARIRKFDDEGKMHLILETISDYLEEEAFTIEEIRDDLDLALWVAYANINIGEYSNFVSSWRWLTAVSDLACGCGVWFYRMSVTLMYLGRLDQAWAVAEDGAQQDPGYPWIWLSVAKLRAHHGDKSGALDAVAHGLELCPGDYEFERLRREIEAGCPLDAMEVHFISPDADARLQDAADKAMDEKRRAKELSVSTILCDEENFGKVMRALSPDAWNDKEVYCIFIVSLPGKSLYGRFLTNRAGVSKFDPGWVARLRAALPQLLSDACHWIDTVWHGKVDVTCLRVHYIDIYPNRSFAIYYEYDKTSDGKSYHIRFTENMEIDYFEQDNFMPYEYTEEEQNALRVHVETYWGSWNCIFAEPFSPDIRINVYCVPPAPGRDYHTLVTEGLGAWTMPGSDSGRCRAELLLCLPPTWDWNDSDNLWPVSLLRMLVRQVFKDDARVQPGYMFASCAPLIDNSRLKGCIVDELYGMPPLACTAVLPGGEEVHYYRVIPVYGHEMDFARVYGERTLLYRLREGGFVFNPNRPDVCEKMPCVSPYASGNPRYKN